MSGAVWFCLGLMTAGALMWLMEQFNHLVTSSAEQRRERYISAVATEWQRTGPTKAALQRLAPDLCLAVGRLTLHEVIRRDHERQTNPTTRRVAGEAAGE